MIKVHMIETASGWTLPESAQHRREPARPVNRRPANFAAQFDELTVVYDCFRLKPTQVMLMAPPLNRFDSILDSLSVQSLPGSGECRYQLEHKFTLGFPSRRTDNLCRILVDVPEAADSLRLKSKAGETVLAIRPKSSQLFRDRRVLFTLSKDNDPRWICDWMRFHRDLQQADAVLLYDNGSTAYTTQSLLQAMQQVAGFSTIVVMEWPYKYGPQGIGRGTWDSAFCQDGAMEDARWRFLGDAQGVLNCDVDELALSDTNLFEQVANSSSGCIRFPGRWVNAPKNATSTSVPTHRESTYQLLPQWRWKSLRLKDINLCPTKWVVVPNRCPQQTHWTAHEIVGMSSESMKPAQGFYRHFRQISTNWKNNRRDIERADELRYQEDRKLQEAFTKVRWNA